MQRMEKMVLMEKFVTITIMDLQKVAMEELAQTPIQHYRSYRGNMELEEMVVMEVAVVVPEALHQIQMGIYMIVMVNRELEEKAVKVVKVDREHL